MQPREAIVEFLARQTIGPAGGDEETVLDAPTEYYIAGILFPRSARASVADDADELEWNSRDDRAVDDPVSHANEDLPSSVGASFLVAETVTSIEVRVAAASYAKSDEGRSGWKRTALPAQGVQTVSVRRSDANSWKHEPPIWDGRAEVAHIWRHTDCGWLVTVCIANIQSADRKMDDKGWKTRVAGECLYQVEMECAPVGDSVKPYPSMSLETLDPEEEDLRMLYRLRKVYAVGHGVAAVWDEPDDLRHTGVPTVSISFMPEYVVHPMVVREDADSTVLQISALAHVDDAVLAGLDTFVDTYESWSRELLGKQKDAASLNEQAVKRCLDRIENCIVRMRRGVGLLRSNADVRTAFSLANEAMALQMMQGIFADLHEAGRERDSFDMPAIDGLDLPEVAPDWYPDDLPYEPRWYPFQLAFALTILDSLALQKSEDRDSVDLIWAETGAGKTEAYLLAAAFVVFYRRLTLGERGRGTAVLTRYTLRLLTAQQFQRTATLVCACERIRQRLEAQAAESERRKWEGTISVGLWIGGGEDGTPNQLRDSSWGPGAASLLELLKAGEADNPFAIRKCPWCGTRLIPERLSPNSDDWGFEVDGDDFVIRCPSESCAFHDRLPVQVVDQLIYDKPPTVVLGTVDKFARLAWEERSGGLFGGTEYASPSLIIQDELHLINGPLGSIMSLYETAISMLIKMRGQPPKVLASTATIRNAGAQCEALYDQKVKLFPPPGLTADDSYFSRLDTEAPGRKYVGLMTPGVTSQTALVHLAAALLQGGWLLKEGSEAWKAYWTLVSYHNSLRELGGMRTRARDDVDARIGVIAPEDARRRVSDEDVVELTGNVSNADIIELIDRMKVAPPSKSAISVLLSSNMISVGVDIRRLSMMLVDGQPKLTSEYIQATSRVGRRKNGPPGLIVTHYQFSKPRDRSHYEGFSGYHQALYRHVEPSSVTPFSLSARDRALHAVLVILARHGLGWSSNSDASRILDGEDELAAVAREIVERVGRVDPDEQASTSAYLEEVIAYWRMRAENALRDGGKPLYYDAKSFKQNHQHHLLRQFNLAIEGWDMGLPTLNSMRNVDGSCPIRLED